ncbi:TRAP transporter permease [Peptoniphilus catoniae]|uniref:TRAP transporter permease n=1 Tax=Peptoniphilus catoniae TaxID=1660341 RepID=UPI0010FF2550|nr:TRAP transporter permease [Peptoniphilus catoniae]
MEKVENNKIQNKLFLIIAVLMSLYHISYAVRPIFSPTENQALHLFFCLVLIYIGRYKKQGIKKYIDYGLALLSAFSTLYIMFHFERLVNAAGNSTKMDIIVGLILLIVLIEATRRAFGAILTGLLVLSLLYARYGFVFTGPLNFFNHSGYVWARLIPSVTVNLAGIFGTVLEVSATYIVLFMIFGGLLEVSGAGEFFINLALALGGRSRSGPAQAAVISSGLVGSINGSAVANVATTGVFTIPMMKDRGYPAPFAGAVESVASTGGMIMPPVMGAAAFVMSGITGIPYAQIAIAALVPALLYYFTTSCTVHLRALKIGLKPLPEDEIPNLKKVLKDGWYFILPLITIMIFMFKGYSALKAGFYGICILLLVVIVGNTKKDKTYLLSKEFRKFIFDGLVVGAESSISVGAACAAMGVVSQTFIMTGLALKIVFFIKRFAGNTPFIGLVLTMIISIFFGMGVPTTASYILVAVLGAPVLVELGYPLLSVHLFIYYYAILANITPPVASAALVGSRIAFSDYYETSIQAVKLGLTGFILPFIFIYHTELLLQGNFIDIFKVVFSCVLGLLSMSIFFEGWFMRGLSTIERILYGVAFILLVYPEFYTDIAGYILFVVLFILQKKNIKKEII